MGEKMSLLDKILFNVYESDFRLDITVKEVELKETKFTGPQQHIFHYNLETRDNIDVYVPLDKMFELEKPAGSTFSGDIIPSSSVATVVLSGWLEPHTAKGHPAWFHRNYDLDFYLTNKETFKIPYFQHEMLLDQIITGEIHVMNQTIGDGMVFEGERVWKTFSNSSYFLDYPNYRKKLFSKLPFDLASKVRDKTRELKESEPAYSPA